MRSNEKGTRIALVCALMVAMICFLAACGAPPQTSGDAKTEEQAEVQESEQATGEETEAEADATTETEAIEADYHDPGEGYGLDQVVVLARHNIRAPLSTGGSVLEKATPHDWIAWTADASHLTLRGGILETMLGQYVRNWLESEGLIEKNWQPTPEEARVYANSLQRTHATAQYFIGGMLPCGDVPVETHYAFNEKDPVFIPYITFTSDAYNEAAIAEVAEMGGEDGMPGVAAHLKDNYELLEDVLDYKESDGYKSGELADLATDDTEIVLEEGSEPAMNGSLKTGCSLADALVLQYYEADNDHAAFGKELTPEQWEQISEIKDYYVDVLFTAPLIAKNVAHPLLALIGEELDTDGRKFSFLCGHDSDLASVLAALAVEDYALPNAIEKKTPIGSMLVFEKWHDADGNPLGRVRLIYQGVEKLRNFELAAAEGPDSYELSFEGLEKNEAGLYPYAELRAHLQGAADAYDEIVATYGDEAELDNAA